MYFGYFCREYLYNKVKEMTEIPKCPKCGVDEPMDSQTRYISDSKVFHGEIPFVMGTRMEMLIVGIDEAKAASIWSALHERVIFLDRMLNRFDPGSEVSLLNLKHKTDGPDMSDELEHLITLATDYNSRTLGLFDIHTQDGGLDFGGFAKGYFLRECKRLLRENGVECAFVDFGGSSILGIGHHPYGDCWKVGVVDPYTRSQVDEVCICNESMSTSGNSPAYEGHIRNPRTGDRCIDRKMVTIVADDPLDAEVLSTAFMVAQDEEIPIILNNFAGIRHYTKS